MPSEVMSMEECINFFAGLPLFTGTGKFSLNPVLHLLEMAGSPHLYLPPVIHVTGTNGKGSVVAYLSHLLHGAGYNVAAFTSPHVAPHYDAALSINCNVVPQQPFREAVSLVKEAMEKGWSSPPSAPPHHLPEAADFSTTREWLIAKGAILPDEGLPSRPSQFEVQTAVCYAATAFFVKPRPDFFIVEVGLGGRLDSTNAIPAPNCCVFTSISNDHSAILGPTPVDIAREKAGIVKPGTQCVVSYRQADRGVAKVLQEASTEAGVPWFVEVEDPCGTDSYTVQFKPDGGRIAQADLACPLPGRHQLTNLVVALQTICCLKHLGLVTQLELHASINNLRHWLRGSRMIDFRFETYEWTEQQDQQDGAAETRPHILVFDGAHNAEAIGGLVQTVETFAKQHSVSNLIVVTGVLADKEVGKIASHFASLATSLPSTKFFPVDVPDNTRSLPASALAAALTTAGISPVKVTASSSASEAYTSIRGVIRAARGRCAVLTAGSFFLAGARAAARTVFTGMKRVT